MSTTDIINIEAPVFPESVTDATVTAIHVKVGQQVKADDKLIDLETDKVVFEVPAPGPGVISEITVKEGDVVVQGDILAKLNENATATTPEAKPLEEKVATPAKAPEPKPEVKKEENKTQKKDSDSGFSSPSARRSGVLSQVNKPEPSVIVQNQPVTQQSPVERVPMTRLRKTIAKRLLDSQHQTATLTTFNQVNLQAVIDLRARYKEKFEKEHGIKLGFMSFFTKAVVAALKEFPAINAFIEGDDLVYHHYYDIGIAVSTERGLVVPVIRNADQMSLSDIEKAINSYGKKARNGTISMSDLNGGTFTITNGGVFGSLLGTPILNPPQSGILGMHAIEQRPIVENGEIVIRPMMYLALSYDHRIVDGKESVQFLTTIKNLLEDPTRFLLDI